MDMREKIDDMLVMFLIFVMETIVRKIFAFPCYKMNYNRVHRSEYFFLEKNCTYYKCINVPMLGCTQKRRYIT